MEAVLAYLRTAHPAAVVDAMCKGPETVTGRHGIPAMTMNWYQRYEKSASGVPSVLLKLLGKGIDAFRTGAWVRRHDVVIVPGMGVMEASLPLKPWALPYSLWLLSAWGRLFGTKVAFVSVGAGVVRKRTTRALLDASARLAFYRSYRDAPSLDAMRQRGHDTADDHVYADLAFGLPALPCGPGDPQVVGIGVMDYHGGNDDRGQAAAIQAQYVAAMKAFIRWLIDNDRSVRILIGDENESDKLVGAELLADARAYRPDLEPGRVAAEYATSFAELMRAMAPVGAVVATRYHTMICALRLGKPVVALSYAPKFAALLAQMGLEEFRQSAGSVVAAVLVAQFAELEKRREEITEAIAAGNAAYEGAAAAQFAELSGVLFAAGDGHRATPGEQAGRQAAGTR